MFDLARLDRSFQLNWNKFEKKNSSSRGKDDSGVINECVGHNNGVNYYSTNDLKNHPVTRILIDEWDLFFYFLSQCNESKTMNSPVVFLKEKEESSFYLYRDPLTKEEKEEMDGFYVSRCTRDVHLWLIPHCSL